MPEPIREGDVVLVDGLGQGLISASIALGTMRRYGRGSPYARWTHVAIVYDAPAQDPDRITIVEATMASGVHRAFISKYENRCAVVHTGVEEHDWAKVNKFLKQVLDQRESYDRVAYAGLTLYAVTGTKICIQRAGTATCSGLVADALTRRGFVWHRPPYFMTPADIAADLLGQYERKMTSWLAEGPTTLRGRIGELVQTTHDRLTR